MKQSLGVGRLSVEDDPQVQVVQDRLQQVIDSSRLYFSTRLGFSASLAHGSQAGAYQQNDIDAATCYVESHNLEEVSWLDPLLRNDRVATQSAATTYGSKLSDTGACMTSGDNGYSDTVESAQYVDPTWSINSSSSSPPQYVQYTIVTCNVS